MKNRIKNMKKSMSNTETMGMAAAVTGLAANVALFGLAIKTSFKN